MYIYISTAPLPAANIRVLSKNQPMPGKFKL